MKQIAVMIVEDSRVVREFLDYIISRDPRLKVVAAVSSAEAALEALAKVRPDVISVDIRLPGMDGFELTKRIMAERPTPIVVISSDVEDEELKISMNALRAGALAVVQKPVGASHADYEAMAANICTKLVIMSEVRVIQQRYRSRSLPLDTGSAASSSLRPARMVERSGSPAILGLVASTGGPNALVRVLSDLGRDFPAPIVLVQHITPGFVHGFVSWLNDLLPLSVVEASARQELAPGTVYVAPAHQHLIITDGRRLGLTQESPVSMQRPSGTVLLRSIARHYGANSAGVVLTGMGDDGALGLKEIWDAGGWTLAEHESTAVVYGMPAAAVSLRAAHEVLPLQEIGPRIQAIFGQLSPRL